MPTASCGFVGQPDLLWTHGPTLPVQIGFDATFQAGVTPRADISGPQLPALVDTGAYESSVDSMLAEALKLPVVGRREVAGSAGPHTVNRHLAQIYVPTLDYTIYGLFDGVHLLAGGQRHVALIGRLFLRSFTLTYDGLTGAATISNDAHIRTGSIGP